MASLDRITTPSGPYLLVDPGGHTFKVTVISFAQLAQTYPTPQSFVKRIGKQDGHFNLPAGGGHIARVTVETKSWSQGPVVSRGREAGSLVLRGGGFCVLMCVRLLESSRTAASITSSRTSSTESSDVTSDRTGSSKSSDVTSYRTGSSKSSDVTSYRTGSSNSSGSSEESNCFETGEENGYRLRMILRLTSYQTLPIEPSDVTSDRTGSTKSSVVGSHRTVSNKSSRSPEEFECVEFGEEDGSRLDAAPQRQPSEWADRRDSRIRQWRDDAPPNTTASVGDRFAPSDRYEDEKGSLHEDDSASQYGTRQRSTQSSKSPGLSRRDASSGPDITAGGVNTASRGTTRPRAPVRPDSPRRHEYSPGLGNALESVSAQPSEHRHRRSILSDRESTDLSSRAVYLNKQTLAMRHSGQESSSNKVHSKRAHDVYTEQVQPGPSYEQQAALYAAERVLIGKELTKKVWHKEFETEYKSKEEKEAREWLIREQERVREIPNRKRTNLDRQIAAVRLPDESPHEKRTLKSLGDSLGFNKLKPQKATKLLKRKSGPPVRGNVGKETKTLRGRLFDRLAPQKAEHRLQKKLPNSLLVSEEVERQTSPVGSSASGSNVRVRKDAYPLVLDQMRKHEKAKWTEEHEAKIQKQKCIEITRLKKLEEAKAKWEEAKATPTRNRNNEQRRILLSPKPATSSIRISGSGFDKWSSQKGTAGQKLPAHRLQKRQVLAPSAMIRTSKQWQQEELHWNSR